jgi:hypothetical protein
MESKPHALQTARPAAMQNPVNVDRWALLHLVLSVGLLPEPAEPRALADLRRCLALCVAALEVEPAVVGPAAA